MSDDLIKVAAEYDAAGRIMARGFVEEFNKLARSLTEGYTIGKGVGPRVQSPTASRIAPKKETQYASVSKRSGGVPKAQPRATLGSVTGKMNFGNKMPSLPGQKKTPSSNVTVGKAVALGGGGMTASGRKALGR